MPDAFITKLDQSGKVVYSTYLGGSSADIAYGIAVDESGNAYVSGTTSSPNFPVTAGAFQTSPPSNSSHVFVAKLNPSGSALVYATLVGARPLLERKRMVHEIMRDADVRRCPEFRQTSAGKKGNPPGGASITHSAV